MNTKKKISLSLLFLAMLLSIFACIGASANAADGTTAAVAEAFVMTDGSGYCEGIGFKLTVSKSEFNSGIAEAGIKLIPAKLLGDGAIAEGTNDRIMTAKVADWTEDGDNMCGNVYVYNIPEGSYGSELVAAAYTRTGDKISFSEEKIYTLAATAKARAEASPGDKAKLEDYYTFYVQFGDDPVVAFEYGDALTEPEAELCEVDTSWTNPDGSLTWDFLSMTVSGHTRLTKKVGAYSHSFEDGHGECASCDAWGIKTAEDFARIGDDLEGNYILTANIDLGNITTYGVGKTSTDEFNGTFDGDGYMLTYTLYSEYTDGNINSDGEEGVAYKALFGTVGESGTVRNVGLKVTSVGAWRDDDTWWGGTPRRAGLAWYNKGIIKDIFLDMTFTEPGAEANGTDCWAQAALVQDNLGGGLIDNVVIKVTYTGTRAITRDDVEAAKEQSLCIIGKNREGATVKNLIYCVDVQNPVDGYIALCSHRTGASDGKYENDGKWTNVLPLNNKADSHTDYSAETLLSVWEDFVANGFEMGRLWTKNADLLSFGGAAAVEAE